jgi:hypothetical protein
MTRFELRFMHVCPANSRQLRTRSKVRLLRSVSGLAVMACQYRPSDSLLMMATVVPASSPGTDLVSRMVFAASRVSFQDAQTGKRTREIIRAVRRRDE